MNSTNTSNQGSALDELLNVFWLRPETALWRSIDIDVMKDFEFRSPSLDMGCGDGIFSFIRAGGRFDPSFDAFQSLTNLEEFFNKVDIFDSFDSSLMPAIKKKPDYMIDYAFDHKDNLLKKAKTLGLYKNFITGDGNDKLPFEDSSLNTIFSNIVYWFDKPEETLQEIARVLKVGGRCCLMLPNNTFPEFCFYHDLYLKQKNEKFKFLEQLDRGRLAEIKHAKSTSDWMKIIDMSGLKVVHHRMHLSKTVIQMWDIGLRPLFPVLHKMAAYIDSDKLMAIKKEFIETTKMFLEPINKLDGDLVQGVEPAFHCFILEK